MHFNFEERTFLIDNSTLFLHILEHLQSNNSQKYLALNYKTSRKDTSTEYSDCTGTRSKSALQEFDELRVPRSLVDAASTWVTFTNEETSTDVYTDV
jgi:hypothetical protein